MSINNSQQKMIIAKSPLVDVTYANAVESLFHGAVKDPWAKNHIDFENHIIKVTAKKGAEDILEREPKKHKNRVFPMSGDSSQILAELYAEDKEGFPYIFISPEWFEQIGERQRIGQWNPRFHVVNNFDRNFRSICRKDSVDKCALYDLRRSANYQLGQEVAYPGGSGPCWSFRYRNNDEILLSCAARRPDMCKQAFE
jgi:hypothetical protein